MAYYGSTHVDNFEIDCSSGTAYVLWEEDCGYDPPQSPLLPAESPRIACGAPFGDHGWFSTTTDTTTAFSSPDGAVISWNGTEIWNGLTTSTNKGWFSYDGNTNSNAGTFFVVDQSTITLNANGGRQYYGKLYKQSGNFVQVGAVTSGQGWRPEFNACGSNPNAPQDVYVSCVKRSSYYHGSPTIGGGGPYYSLQTPSAACGAPYGDGWFEVECSGGYTRTIIVVEGVDVYDGSWIARSGNDVEVTIGDYRYIRSSEPNSSYFTYAGLETTGCGGLPYPQGCGGNGRGVYRVPID